MPNEARNCQQHVVAYLTKRFTVFYVERLAVSKAY